MCVARNPDTSYKFSNDLAWEAMYYFPILLVKKKMKKSTQIQEKEYKQGHEYRGAWLMGEPSLEISYHNSPFPHSLFSDFPLHGCWIFWIDPLFKKKTNLFSPIFLLFVFFFFLGYVFIFSSKCLLNFILFYFFFAYHAVLIS